MMDHWKAPPKSPHPLFTKWRGGVKMVTGNTASAKVALGWEKTFWERKWEALFFFPNLFITVRFQEAAFVGQGMVQRMFVCFVQTFTSTFVNQWHEIHLQQNEHSSERGFHKVKSFYVVTERTTGNNTSKQVTTWMACWQKAKTYVSFHSNIICCFFPSLVPFFNFFFQCIGVSSSQAVEFGFVPEEDKRWHCGHSILMSRFLTKSEVHWTKAQQNVCTPESCSPGHHNFSGKSASERNRYRALVHIHFQKYSIWILHCKLFYLGSNNSTGTTPRKSKISF